MEQAFVFLGIRVLQGADLCEVRVKHSQSRSSLHGLEDNLTAGINLRKSPGCFLPVGHLVG